MAETQEENYNFDEVFFSYNTPINKQTFQCSIYKENDK